MHPILFYLGPFPVRAYSFMVFVGFVLALFYTKAVVRLRMAGRKPDAPGVITPEHVVDMSLVALVIGILGSRLLYVLFAWPQYRDRPQDVFKVWQGGMSAYGAIVFGFPYLWWYCRRHKLSFLAFADLCAPGLALAYAIGRIGCFLNGCCYGQPTDPPLGMVFIKDGLPNAPLTPPSHPAQLYSTAMNLVIFFVLDRWGRRPHRNGEIFLGYLALYCVYRTIYEAFRVGATAEVWFANLTSAQVINLGALPLILFFLWRVRRRDNVLRAA